MICESGRNPSAYHMCCCWDGSSGICRMIRHSSCKKPTRDLQTNMAHNTHCPSSCSLSLSLSTSTTTKTKKREKLPSTPVANAGEKACTNCRPSLPRQRQQPPSSSQQDPKPPNNTTTNKKKNPRSQSGSKTPNKPKELPRTTKLTETKTPPPRPPTPPF